MKIFIYTIFLIFIIFPSFSGEDDAENEYVKVSININPKEIKVNGRGDITASFKTTKGIYINIEPPIEFELDSNIVVLGKIEIPESKNSEYLNTKKPVKQKFKIKENIKSGKYLLKGNLIYFYCSEKEGWCSRFKQPISMNIKVVK